MTLRCSLQVPHRRGVVPVALHSYSLRQSHGGCGNQRLGRLVDHWLQGKRGAVDHLTPAPVVSAPREPAPPVFDSLPQEVEDLLRREWLSGPVFAANELGEDERSLLALLQGESRPHRSPQPLRERHVGGETQGEAPEPSKARPFLTTHTSCSCRA